MTDRELLEMAAKAAGYDIQWNEKWPCGGSYMIRVVPEPTDPIMSKWIPWNPLSDDGDALRLAVKMGICIGPESPDVIGKSLCRASWNNKVMSLGEYGDGDPLAATRRAIVRAAAEIGRAMP